MASREWCLLSADRPPSVGNISLLSVQVCLPCCTQMTEEDSNNILLQCTEGKPDNAGPRMANELWKSEIPVRVILDVAMAYEMERVDMVLVGADGVVESGGIINALGTFQISVVARAMNKPVYVAAESYKVSSQ